MTDRELYNHIRATYKPDKGTVIFFDLRNYHLCGLQPRVIQSKDELFLSVLDCSEKIFRGFVSYLDEEVIFDFSYTDFFQIENLTTQKVINYQEKRLLDDDELSQILEKMILSIEKLKTS